jgi:hypothetical protein
MVSRTTTSLSPIDEVGGLLAYPRSRTYSALKEKVMSDAGERAVLISEAGSHLVPTSSPRGAEAE